MLSFLCIVLLSFSWLGSAQQNNHEGFLQCLPLHSDGSAAISKLIHTPIDSSYTSVLQSTMQNLRFNTTATPKPIVIVTPQNPSHIQAAIICAQKHNLQLRIRSGGHDYEGLSYVARDPFVVVDMTNLREVNVDVETSTAWVQSGATLGEFYYKIGNASRTLAFPAGFCPTVGVGGYISGGGYGGLLRKYGLAADNVIDAQLVDVKGRILDRASMGEDLFWAIRGGGGNTFGVVVAWKVNLVKVPPTVTVFSVPRTLEQNATKLIHRWQYIGSKFPQELLMAVLVGGANVSGSGGNQKTVVATFNSLYLGGADKLLELMQESFPELGLVKEDCREVSWIEFVVFFSGYPPNSSLDVLLNRTPLPILRRSFKAKSDYVREPMPESAWEGMWEKFFIRINDTEAPTFFMTPYGGRMGQIPESQIPFPHRAGVLFKIHYLIFWDGGDNEVGQRSLSLIRGLYTYLTPYVSKNPREAYVNYRDLDLGTNNQGRRTSYRQARLWGLKYFKNNFDRYMRTRNNFRDEAKAVRVAVLLAKAKVDKELHEVGD
ncbi:hypothetical protein Tsubulata_024562 [Turnera subulata]|uniref:FAD-binding PCMH-type domain-containing protein n=1 Tax=Turnera subulata TaxID=218843 RepID=A0A9Q0G5C1_9ROSI|nr:hypothetical protein Tsubulata_024562 [Turnera subulata]